MHACKNHYFYCLSGQILPLDLQQTGIGLNDRSNEKHWVQANFIHYQSFSYTLTASNFIMHLPALMANKFQKQLKCYG